MAESRNDKVEFANAHIQHFKKKADHNKFESLSTYQIIMLSTLLAPIFITLGDTIVLEKIIPSVLSVSAALGTSWLQLRKPQQLWSTYRTTQKEIEYELSLYQFNAGKYEDAAEADSMFIENVSRLVFVAHDKWLNVVPKPSDPALKSKSKNRS